MRAFYDAKVVWRHMTLMALLFVAACDGCAYAAVAQVLNRLIISGLGLKALPWEVMTVTPVGSSLNFGANQKPVFRHIFKAAHELRRSCCCITSLQC
jgi:hypothetical protein